MSMLINFFLSLIGFYLIAESFYLAAKANEERRHCLIAKYVFVGLCGIYSVKTGISGSVDGIDSSHQGLHLMFASTVALCIWRDTFYRALGWLERYYPPGHHYIVARLGVSFSRREDLAR